MAGLAGADVGASRDRLDGIVIVFFEVAVSSRSSEAA